MIYRPENLCDTPFCGPDLKRVAELFVKLQGLLEHEQGLLVGLLIKIVPTEAVVENDLPSSRLLILRVLGNLQRFQIPFYRLLRLCDGHQVSSVDSVEIHLEDHG